MSEVQWRDPARPARRPTPIETGAGQPSDATEHS
jgi:hypothetical protein